MARNAGEVAKRLVAALLFAFLMGAPARAELLIFAAASLTDVTNAIADRFSGATGEQAVLSFGSSSTLARQIEAGAPADIFISANKEWVDYVRDKAGFGEGIPLFSNTLVIAAPPGSDVDVTLEDLPQALGDGRLAVGDPEHVPAGIYAKEALDAAGLWEELEFRLAPAEDVRAALRLVERSAAPFGIVYATDARAGNVAIAGEIDPRLYGPVIYYLSLRPDYSITADAFTAFLTNGQMDEVIAGFGFQPLEAGQ